MSKQALETYFHGVILNNHVEILFNHDVILSFHDVKISKKRGVAMFF